MNKCPYCGAEIQENAQFCLYCMKSLTKKTRITPVRRSRKIMLFVIAAVLICITLSVTIGFLRFKNSKTIADTSAEKQTSNDIQADTDFPIIANFDDFSLRAVFLTGKLGLSDLWNPDGLVNTHTGIDGDGDVWKIYSTDVKIEGVDFKIHFCEDGEEIITAITGLTDATYSDGVRLAECAVSSVYNYTYTNLIDMLTDHNTYPLWEIENGNRIMALAELPDPTFEMVDSDTVPVIRSMVTMIDTAGYETQQLIFELRTRIYGGETVYDIFLLHTQN